MEEELLIKRCINGEPSAQRKIYEKYAPSMLAVCMRYVKNKEVATDLMHDGFIRLFTKIDTYSGTGVFAGWVRRIFVNTALEYLRHNDALRFSVDIDSAVYLSSEDWSVIDKISADELMGYITELPDKFRTVFNMYAVEGYSHAEIAKELNIQEVTSRTQYARAKQALQKIIKENSKYIVWNEATNTDAK